MKFFNNFMYLYIFKIIGLLVISCKKNDPSGVLTQKTTGVKLDLSPAIKTNLSVENIQVENENLTQPGRKSFERTSGWA